MSKDERKPLQFSDDDKVNEYVRDTCAAMYRKTIELGAVKEYKVKSPTAMLMALNVAFNEAVNEGLQGDTALVEACNILRRKAGVEPTM